MPLQKNQLDAYASRNALPFPHIRVYFDNRQQVFLDNLCKFFAQHKHLVNDPSTLSEGQVLRLSVLQKFSDLLITDVDRHEAYFSIAQPFFQNA